MTEMGFEWQIDEFMVYCRSRQLREKTMNSYEQTLRLFQRWCEESLRIREVDKVSESVIRRYINDLQERGKYSFYADDRKKEINHPDRRRDFRKPVSVITINNYVFIMVCDYYAIKQCSLQYIPNGHNAILFFGCVLPKPPVSSVRLFIGGEKDINRCMQPYT